MANNIPIRDLGKRWLELDRDQSTRDEIEQLMAQSDEAELERRLRKRIAFGTAGLRSSMKAGWAHMNSVTVQQASLGLAQYIIDQRTTSPNSSEDLRVVIGYDGRHNSEKYARLAAASFISKGFSVLWFGQLVHTPMVPFAVSYYKASAGVMVTASHNPKQDNGYKVYWSNGCQIIPPYDRGIAHAIEGINDQLSWDTALVEQSLSTRHIYSESTLAYDMRLQKLISPLTPVITFTYTPMHGVGLPFMQQVATMLGHRPGSMHVVEAQAFPDPEFPTVPFPNPEEKGALNLAFKEADANGSSLVIANDPDADRFAAALKIDGGKWHQFTGNQMGVLLASYVLETYGGEKSNLIMLASTVSSRMLAAMAAQEGFRFEETLTGFKWLGNVAQRLAAEGLEPAYAYEEAIGYMFPSVVWDKDGIAAAAVFLTASEQWAKQGLTPWRKLQALYASYGYFEDANTYLISPSPDVTERVFTAIRTSGMNGSVPETVGKRKILQWRDLTKGYDTASIDGKPELPVDPSAQMITCHLEDDVVFTARGSGTEPKIKLYIEAKATSSAAAQAAANGVLEDLMKEWFTPEYKLTLAGC